MYYNKKRVKTKRKKWEFIIKNLTLPHKSSGLFLNFWRYSLSSWNVMPGRSDFVCMRALGQPNRTSVIQGGA